MPTARAGDTGGSKMEEDAGGGPRADDARGSTMAEMQEDGRQWRRQEVVGDGRCKSNHVSYRLVLIWSSCICQSPAERGQDVVHWQKVEFAGEQCCGDPPEQWFFFTPRQVREARGGRPNRFTSSGYWKVTGSPGYSDVRESDYRKQKTRVFYKEKSPSGIRIGFKVNTRSSFKFCSDALRRTMLFQILQIQG
ncbi:hypothetical protein NE237_018628 [Protea cynaroides]|uniref:NAC domain-containing protein n=1 Tax=Protea cynaroides TaxID=273540 RepID=A0A9Q0QPC8_9MAGN|nr:hypothetical protein NE237_018628 [Protea cynaroides]